MTKIQNYIRTHRKRWGLTQPELAHLLGELDASLVSRFELGRRLPSLQIALRYQVVFGLPPAALFPGAYDDAEEEVMRRALELWREVDGQRDRNAVQKRQLLREMMTRAGSYTEGL